MAWAAAYTDGQGVEYTITYELAGGSVATENPATYTTESLDITLNNPTRKGYTFAGWTGTDLSEATITVTIASGSTGDRTYTATWTPNTYTVHFHANGGSGTMADQQFTYDVAQNLTANAFTYDPCSFNGWNTKSDGSGTIYTNGENVENLTAEPNGEINLYAQWTCTTPLTFEAIADGTIRVVHPKGNMKYSINSDEMTSINILIEYSDINVNAGDIVKFFGNASCYGADPVSSDEPTRIICLTDCYVYGNIMSLISPSGFSIQKELNAGYTFAYLFQVGGYSTSDKHYQLKSHPTNRLVLPATTLSAHCYEGMFYDCTSLTTAPALPATTLAANCYQEMFNGCTSLTQAPELPATTLAANCYQNMFFGCTSLTTAPTLPATTLVNSCYQSMFYDCTSLTTAPALPATTLAANCYQEMFNGCTALTTAPALPATTLSAHCYESMFYNCTSLTTAPTLPATTLASDCYYNMLVGTNVLPDCSHIDFKSQTVVDSGGLRGLFAWTKITDAQLQAILTASGIEGYTLPVTTLTANCYQEMFSGCTNLTTAPTLPATTLAANCYQDMFSGCTNLNYVKCLATNISAADCTKNWLFNISTSGMFIGACNTWGSGASGIPSNWHSLTIDPATEQFYDISLQEGVKASILFSDNNLYNVDYAPNGRTVTLSAPGYTPSSYTVTKTSDNTPVTVTNTNGVYTFTMPQSNVTVAATLTSNSYTVVLHDNNGSSTETTASVDATYGNGASLPDCSFTAPDGKVFSHWNTAADGTGTSYANQADGSRLTTEAGVTVNLYAQWAEEKYTVPLTLEAVNDGTTTITLRNPRALAMRYSTDGGATIQTSSASPVTIVLTAAGQTVQLYGNDENTGKNNSIFFDQDCYAYGNVMSLLDEVGFATKKTLTGLGFGSLFDGNGHLKNHATKELLLPATTLTENCYINMFRSCTGLTRAPELPATTLAARCYVEMFNNCTSLTRAPELPATTMKVSCYQEMFVGCTSLTTAPPELPATTLADLCYANMFFGCTSLIKAPALPATTLVNNCYNGMFYGCTALTHIEMLAADISANCCLLNWVGRFDSDLDDTVQGVPATGIFVKNSEMTSLPAGLMGIPNNWDVLSINPATEQTYDISLPEGVTATITFDDNKAHAVDFAPNGRIVTLNYSGAIPNVGMKKLSATAGTMVSGEGQTATLTMPASDVTVSLADCTPVITVAQAAWTGSAVEPAVTVVDGETTLTLGTDYTVSYSNNINAGENTATVTITGKDLYLGTASQTFSIAKKVDNYGAITITDYGSTKKAVIDGSSTEVVSITEAIEVDGVTINRTFTKDVASTVFLPFGIAKSNVKGGKFYTFTSVDETKSPWEVTYTVVTDNLVANTPYIFLPDGTNEGKIVVNNGSDKISLQTAAGSTKLGSWEFIGTYSPITWTAGHADLGKVYGFAARAYDAEGNDHDVAAGDFVKAAAGASIVAGRAYLKRTVQNGARTRSAATQLPDRLKVVLIGANGETTALDGTFVMEQEPSADSEWYDLSGRKLSGKPTKKGMYISNGRKVVVH